ncbi:hypothetical protein NL676_018917 [Syzygium grande]|nr:hypothetical protein NL676_018917 [Syzygium grande]
MVEDEAADEEEEEELRATAGLIEENEARGKKRDRGARSGSEAKARARRKWKQGRLSEEQGRRDRARRKWKQRCRRDNMEGQGDREAGEGK